MDTNDGIRKLVVRVVLFVLIGWAVALLRAVRRDRAWDDWTDTNSEWKPAPLPVEDDSDEQPAKRRPFRAHKLATSMGLVVVFFAAASFTAAGGDMVAKAFDPARCAALMQVTGEDDSVCADMMNDEATPEAMPLPDPAAAAPEAAEPAAQPAEPASELPAELADDLAAAEAGADLEPASAADASLASDARRRRPHRTLPQQLPLRIPSRTCSRPSSPTLLRRPRATRVTGWSSARRSRSSPPPPSKTKVERRPCG